MVVAILIESDMNLPDDLLEAIVDKVYFLTKYENLASVKHANYRTFTTHSFFFFFFFQTIADVDKDSDGKISKEDWKAFVSENPSLLMNMTLPYLKYEL